MRTPGREVLAVQIENGVVLRKSAATVNKHIN